MSLNKAIINEVKNRLGFGVYHIDMPNSVNHNVCFVYNREIEKILYEWEVNYAVYKHKCQLFYIIVTDLVSRGNSWSNSEKGFIFNNYRLVYCIIPSLIATLPDESISLW